MTDRALFSVAGIRTEKMHAAPPKRRRKFPFLPLTFLCLIVLGCAFAGLLTAKDPSYLDLANYSKAPDAEFLFGTDTLGRDIFSCIWYGGRVSLLIGFAATALSTAIAILYGSVSGMAPVWLDGILMRLTEVSSAFPRCLPPFLSRRSWVKRRCFPSPWSSVSPAGAALPRSSAPR